MYCVSSELALLLLVGSMATNCKLIKNEYYSWEQANKYNGLM